MIQPKPHTNDTWVHLTAKSGNGKTGPLAVSTTGKNSCPDECALKDTDCYARFGPLGIHWKLVSEGKRGDNWAGFCNRLLSLPAGRGFRHNQAGDLPQTKSGTIHFPKMKKLVDSAKHLLGFTYTHYDPTNAKNRKAIDYANNNGFTVNLSADSLTQADEYAKIGPTVCILPIDAPSRGNKTPGGLPIVVCPAQTSDVTCAQCMLCQKSGRKSIVGFLSHGTAKKRLSNRIKEQK